MQLGARQAERFHLPRVLGVDLRAAIFRDLAALLEFVHALLQARFSVDQSFSSVTHESAHYTAGCTRCRCHGCTRADLCSDDTVLQFVSDQCESHFHPAVAEWFRAVFADADGAAEARLAADCARRVDADSRADRQRQDADRVPVVAQPADVRAGAGRRRRAAACSTFRRSRRWPSTSSATCARRSRAFRTSPAGQGIAVSHADDRRPHRRHAGRRAREVSAGAGRHPDHDAGIAVPAADVERAREPAVGRDGDHRRDSRAGLDQARRAPGAVARAARTDRRTSRCNGSGCRRRSGRWTKWRGISAARPMRSRRRTKRHEGARTLKDSQAPKTDFAESVHDGVRRRSHRQVPAGHDRRCERAEAAGDHRADAGRRHGGDGQAGRAAERAGVAGAGGAVDLELDSSEAGRADSIASLDAAVRQQPAPRRAAGRRAQRDCRRAAGARASRLAGARAAHRDRGSAEGRTPARAGRDLVARARHRHGRDRPGDPDRGAAVGGQRPAAHRPRRPQHRPGQRRHHLPEVSRRPGGVRRGDRGDAAGQGRIVPLSAQSARRARAAAGGDGVDGAMVGRRSLPHRPIGGAVRRVEPADLRRRARHAVGPLSVGRLRGAAAARDVGSRQRHGDGAAGRQARGDRQCRHHSRSRLVRRVPVGRREGQGARRRARRGNGVRGARRRNVSARRLDVAHRSDHARSRAGVAGARRAGQDAVLEGRRPGPAGRARHGDRQAGARAAQAANRRTRSPRSQQRSRPRCARQRATC